MRDRILTLAAAALAVFPAAARSAVTATTTHGAGVHDLDSFITGNDAANLIRGMIATELPGDRGWHPANTDPADQLPAFTDGQGMRYTNLTGLLNDFPPFGQPTKLVEYDFAQPVNVGTINIFSGNADHDGRVFSTTVIYYSTDMVNFPMLGYFQSDPSGTINNAYIPVADQIGSTMVSIKIDGGELSNIKALEFDMYAVDNTQGEMRDPFDGLNPFTNMDDGLTPPNTSPKVLELQVLPAAPSFIKGDMNGDGSFNNFDITPFVLALTDPTTYNTQYPAMTSIYQQVGDMNSDGSFNNFDITPFVTALTTPHAAEQMAAALASVPEPAGIALLAGSAIAGLRRRRR